MGVSIRSCLTVGVATITAATIAVVPSVKEPVALASHPPLVRIASPAVTLTALLAQPTALSPQQPLLNTLLNSPLALLGPAAPLGTLPPPPAPVTQASPPAPSQFAIAPNLANTIDNFYISVEPWVQYGFEVATAVVRWIPYVGWFAGLIMDGYFFGESLVASAVFNTTDWLRGNGGIVQNVVDFGVDVGLAFVWLGIDAVGSFIPLPPCNCYPPRPPVEGPFLASTALVDPTATADLSLLSAEPKAVDQVEDLTKEDLTKEDLTKEEVTEEAAIKTASVDTPATEDQSQQIQTEVTEEVVTPAAEDATDVEKSETTAAKAEAKEPTTAAAEAKESTTTEGTVKAQGEVRSGSQATGNQSAAAEGSTADAKPVDKPVDKPVAKPADKPVDAKPADPKSVDAGTTKDATTTAHEKADKNASIGAGKDKHSKDKQAD